MHCQVELGQYYNSRSVGEELCVVIHFKSWECSYRWRSLWMKCLLCPSVFTESRGTWEFWFNTKECLRTLTPTLTNNCTVTQYDTPKFGYSLKAVSLKLWGLSCVRSWKRWDTALTAGKYSVTSEDLFLKFSPGLKWNSLVQAPWVFLSLFFYCFVYCLRSFEKRFTLDIQGLLLCIWSGLMYRTVRLPMKKDAEEEQNRGG